MDETDTHRRSWTFDDALAERLAPWAIGGVALAVLSTAIATFQFIGTQDSGVGSGTDWFWTIFSSVATAAIAFGVLLEAGTRGAHLDSFAGWFGVLALASCAIFWPGCRWCSGSRP